MYKAASRIYGNVSFGRRNEKLQALLKVQHWILSHNLQILLCILTVLLNLPKPYQCPQLHMPPSLMACLLGWCSSGANPWDTRSLWPKRQKTTSFTPKPYLNFGSVDVGGYLTCTSHPALEWLYCKLLTAWHSAADPEALGNAVFAGPSWSARTSVASLPPEGSARAF